MKYSILRDGYPLRGTAPTLLAADHRIVVALHESLFVLCETRLEVS